jgi:hypothetical protein
MERTCPRYELQGYWRRREGSIKFLVSILSFCLCIAWEIEGKREVIPAKVRVFWSCEDV